MYESGEDYLEAILMIRNEKEIVRSVDVARKLMVSKPSVSRALRCERSALSTELQPQNWFAT